MDGTVVGIFIAPEEAAPVVSLERVQAVAGRGLEGDRYYHRDGAGPAQEITLIEAERLEAAGRDQGLDLAPGEHRRNIVTSGVELETLLGTRFTVGDAEVEAIRQNPPCRYLQDLTGKSVLEGLRNGGGVRGRIVTSGEIRLGDRIGRRSAVS
ncbi:MAG: MOSC domain-containing protein [Acidimicrobiia bacterium]